MFSFHKNFGLVLITSVLLTGSFALAEETLDIHKAKALQAVDTKSERLAGLRTCIEGAADQATMKACREKHREDIKAHRLENEVKRHERRLKQLKK